jgi:DNA invertase Pin-like site-specific DNA recombinase
MSKFYGYIRVSTEKQEESRNGLEDQQWMIHNFYPGIEIITEIQSGKTIENRPLLDALIKKCIKEKASIVVSKVDRLARDTEEGLMMMRTMENRIRFLDLPDEGSGNELMLTMYFAFATHERKLIAMRTRAALARKRERGEPMGTNLPQCKNNFARNEFRLLGAKARKDTARNHKENKQTLAHVQSLLKEGLTYRQIVDRLAQSDYQTSTGGKWSIGSLSKLINRD